MKFKLSILFVTLWLGCILSAHSQWVPTGGPFGASANNFAKSNGGKIWVCADNGLYYSTNDGNTWNPINKKLDHCTQVIAFGDTIMAVYNPFVRSSVLWVNDYYEPRIISSIDNGNTWGTYYVIDSINMSPSVYPLMDLKKIGNDYIYAFQSGGSVFESHDFGMSWSDSLVTAIPYTTVLNATYINQTAFQQEEGLNQSMQSVIYNCVSFNGRNSWAYIDSSGNNNLKPIGAIDNAILFLADTLAPKILRSTNLAATFDTVLVADPLYPSYSSMYNDKDTLYMKFNDNNLLQRTYKSTDKGITWIQLPAHFPDLGNSRFVRTTNGDYLYGVPWEYNVWKYDPINDTSIQFNTNLKSHWTGELISSGSDLYGIDKNNLFRSSDDGLTWTLITHYTSSIAPINAFTAKGDTVLYLSINTIYISFNKGNTWASYVNPAGFGGYDKIFISNNSLLFQYSSNSVQISSNWGQSWNALTLPSAPVSAVHKLVQDDNFTIYDFVMDTNSTAQLYIYNPVSQSFANVGASNLLSVVGSNFSITKTGNKWFAYGYSNNAAVLASSPDGLFWTLPNLSLLPPSSLLYPYYGRPVSANGIYFSYYNDSSMISSLNGVNWILMPSINNLKFQSNWDNNHPQEMIAHKDILFMPSFSSSVWRRNDTIRNFTGNIYYDVNNNGIKEASETNLQNMVVSTPNAFANSNALGNFVLLTDQLGDSLKVTLPSNSFSSNPSYRITASNQLANNDFGLYGPPNISDFKIDATNTTPFKPGFQTNLVLKVTNHGTLNQTSTLTLNIDTNVIVLSTNPVASSISGNVYTWNLPAIPFTQQQTIQLQVETKATAQLGDTTHFVANITPANADIYLTNNMDTLDEIIVGSFDPNDKTCLQGDTYTLNQLNNNERLEYIVRFQNMGSFPASFIRIEDTLSHLLDWSSIQVLNSSHTMTYDLKGKGVVHFNFNPINLPGMSQNEPASHGFVKYSILPKKSVTVGNVIANTASIYFDFNAPIVTNTTLTEIVYPSLVLSAPGLSNANHFDQTILVYPNPASTHFSVDLSYIKPELGLRLFMYSPLGHLKGTASLNDKSTKINISHYTRGMYLGIIKNSKGKTISTFKIVLNQ
jgi:hypothetical protein